MTRYERVCRVLARQALDKVPKGEWQLSPGLVAEILGYKGAIGWEQQAEVREFLGMDLVVVSADDQVAVETIHRWRQETDFFIFALVDGPFQALAKQQDFVDYLLRIGQRDQWIKQLAQQQMVKSIATARQCLQYGAHGVLVADDVAYADGLFVPYPLMQEFFIPLWRQLVQAFSQDKVPVFFHSDGNINSLLPALMAVGCSGIHAIDPLAGMDIRQVKRVYGDRLCLMGNIDCGFLSTASTEAITTTVKDLLTMATRGGGFILSTSSGYLGDDVPAANVIAMYHSAEEFKLKKRGT
jgi:uroporphyrinogen decarboxylase